MTNIGEDLQFRFIYFVQAGRKIVILHGFHEKTPKTPKRELEIAVRRQYDFLDRYGL